MYTSGWSAAKFLGRAFCGQAVTPRSSVPRLARRDGAVIDMGVPHSSVRRGLWPAPAPRPSESKPWKGGPRQVTPPSSELRHDRAPVGIKDVETLGDSQACEKSLATAAHVWFGQVDSDPREARRGGGGGAGGRDPRSPSFR